MNNIQLSFQKQISEFIGNGFSSSLCRLQIKSFTNLFVLGVLVVFNFSFAFAGDKPTSSLSIKKVSIEQIFRLEKGNATTVSLVDAENITHIWNGNITTHINKGDASGVMSLMLQTQEGEIKMLMSRKELNGKLVYVINLINYKSKSGFKLKEEKDGIFILENTALETIVTP